MTSLVYACHLSVCGLKYQPSGARCTPSMRTSKIQHGRQETKKLPIGSGMGSTPRLLDAPINLPKISFLILVGSN